MQHHSDLDQPAAKTWGDVKGVVNVLSDLFPDSAGVISEWFGNLQSLKPSFDHESVDRQECFLDLLREIPQSIFPRRRRQGRTGRLGEREQLYLEDLVRYFSPLPSPMLSLDWLRSSAADSG